MDTRRLKRISVSISFSSLPGNYYSERESDLLRQQEVGQHLEPSHRVQVSVELHQRLGLVIGQPDGGDALKQKYGHGQGKLDAGRNGKIRLHLS